MSKTLNAFSQNSKSVVTQLFHAALLRRIFALEMSFHSKLVEHFVSPLNTLANKLIMEQEAKLSLG